VYIREKIRKEVGKLKDRTYNKHRPDLEILEEKMSKSTDRTFILQTPELEILEFVDFDELAAYVFLTQQGIEIHLANPIQGKFIRAN
jgi:hypothetical protein